MPKTFLAFVATILVGCASPSSSVLVGTPRPPISPDAVKLYLEPPKRFENVALLEASSRHSFSFSDQAKADAAIRRLREEAAKLGANGILLQGFGAQYAGSVGFATGTTSGNTGFATGISGGVFHKSGNGIAIFVSEE